MLSNLWQNLTKNQKIVFFALLQLVVIVVLVVALNTAFGTERQHVEIENNDVLSNVPKSDRDLLDEQLWNLIQNNVAGVDRSVIDDAVVRDGTYKETNDGEGNLGATFLLDIDSIKQTYAISIVWTTNRSEIVADSVYVDCPPIDQMKYPETVCYGMYNNTYSLDLYLPHAVYPEGYNPNADDAYPLAPNYIIHGDEDTKTIDIEVSACDPDKFKGEALEYLSTTPINLSDYTVNYNINNTDTGC